MPFSKKILPKLHKFLFPTQYNKVVFLDSYVASLQKELEQTKDNYKQLLKEEQNIHKKKPKPTMADLMRECVGAIPIDFSNVIQNPDADEESRLSPEELAARNKDLGLPKDFLDTLDKVKRDTYLAQLYQIWQFEVFPLMIEHYINLQGNWTIRKAIDDTQVFAGRMTINGIYLIKNKVKSGHDEYKDRSKPPEEFDQHELDEGFDINNLSNKK